MKSSRARPSSAIRSRSGTTCRTRPRSLIDSEIKRLIEDGHKRATQVLTENIDQLHAVAGALLEYETLTGDEIKRLAAGDDIGRPDPGASAPALPAGGTSIPKTKRPNGPFGNPAPAGA